MNEQDRSRALLEKHFDIAFAAPDGIKKLRELILTLAMQGKLVPQDPNDQPASELLKDIEAEKRRLVKAGKIRESKPLPDIKPEDVPYELPKSWEWVRLQQCYHSLGSKKNQIQTKGYQELGAFPIIDQGKEFIAGYTDDGDKLLDVTKPVVVFGDHTKNIKFVDFSFVIGADGVKILCPYNGIFSKYLYFVIKSFCLFDRGYARHFKVLNDNLLPLPPLAEQQRIVARIDQLMARCEELEKLRAEREAKRLTVHISALNRLFEAQGSDSFYDAWHFINRHFSELYFVKANVTELRKAILQLGIMGKLVSQDPNNQPASELLKEIEAEKRRLVKEGKIKPQKPLPEIKSEDVPYALPKGWEWVRLGSFCDKVSDGFHHTPKKISQGIRYVSATHIYNGRIDWNSGLYVSEGEYLELYKKTKHGFGDILVVNRGAGCGDAAIVDTNERFCFQNAAIIGFNQNYVDGQYILYFLHASRSHFLDKFIQGGAQPMLSNKLLATHILALPPLAEQKRIVAKIDKFMALCDHLELQIDATAKKQSVLLNAVMSRM